MHLLAIFLGCTSSLVGGLGATMYATLNSSEIFEKLGLRPRHIISAARSRSSADLAFTFTLLSSLALTVFMMWYSSSQMTLVAGPKGDGPLGLEFVKYLAVTSCGTLAWNLLCHLVLF